MKRGYWANMIRYDEEREDVIRRQTEASRKRRLRNLDVDKAADRILACIMETDGEKTD